MEDRYLNLIVAAVPIVVAFVTAVGVVIVKIIERRPLRSVDEGDHVPAPALPAAPATPAQTPADKLEQQYLARIAEKDERIDELEDEVRHERHLNAEKAKVINNLLRRHWDSESVNEAPDETTG